MKANAIRLFVVLIVVLLTSFAQAQDTLVLYDNFKARLINPDKWYGSEDPGGREVLRAVQKQQLRMMDRVYGVKNTDSGYESGYLNLNFTKPNPIHTIKATVSSESFQCVGCNANPSSYSWVSAYIQGYFFNTDDSSIPGDQTNDVRARLGIDASTNTSDQPSELRVVAKVQKCNNSDCTDITTMFTQDLGALALGQQAKLYLKWDKPNYRFLFRRDFEPWVSYAYDSNLQKSVPGINIKRLTVAGNAANCKAAPRTVAMMNAFFDNIYINN